MKKSIGKAFVKKLMDAINSRDVEAAKIVLDPDYEQHNPFIADKAEGLLNKGVIHQFYWWVPAMLGMYHSD